MKAREDDITGLLRGWVARDPSAAEELFPLVYDKLRSMASKYLLRERPDHTLQATELVHEAYMRLMELRSIRWQDRGHFFAMSARVMRRILVEHARARCREKRGGGVVRVPIEDAFNVGIDRPFAVLALHDALSELELLDERKARILELRFFGGLSVKETAETLECSVATVYRHSTLAKAWLVRELR